MVGLWPGLKMKKNGCGIRVLSTLSLILSSAVGSISCARRSAKVLASNSLFSENFTESPNFVFIWRHWEKGRNDSELTRRFRTYITCITNYHYHTSSGLSGTPLWNLILLLFCFVLFLIVVRFLRSITSITSEKVIVWKIENTSWVLYKWPYLTIRYVVDRATWKHQHLYLTCRKAFRQTLKKMCCNHVDLTSETEESTRFYKQS